MRTYQRNRTRASFLRSHGESVSAIKAETRLLQVVPSGRLVRVSGDDRIEAIAKADGRKGNAAWLVRAPMLWLRKAPGTRVDRGDVHWHMPTTGA